MRCQVRGKTKWVEELTRWQSIANTGLIVPCAAWAAWIDHIFEVMDAARERSVDIPKHVKMRLGGTKKEVGAVGS